MEKTCVGRWTSAMVTWLCTFILLISQVKGQQLTIGPSPKNATVSVGETVVLTCVFSQPVDCNWMKDDQPFRIKSGDGNTYTGDRSDGLETRDCSIKISHVTENDFARWHCASFATRGIVAVVSEAIWITKRVTPSAPVILFNNKIVSEIKLPSSEPPRDNLECVSENGNPAAELSWETNGTPYLGRLEIVEVSPNNYTVKLFWDRGVGWQIFENSSDVVCKAKHPGFTSTMAARLEFKRNFAPKTVKVWAEGFDGGDVKLRRGESVVLACISDGQPGPRYTWEHWSEKDQRWNFFSLYAQNVTVTSDQLGRYRCNANNQLNRHSPTSSINEIVVSEQIPKSVEDVKQEREVPSVFQLLLSNSVKISSVFMNQPDSTGSVELKSTGATVRRGSNQNGAFISIINQLVISDSNLISDVSDGDPQQLVTSCDSGPNASVANIRLAECGSSKLGFQWDPLPCDPTNGPLTYRYVLRTTEDAPGGQVVVVNGTTADTKVTVEHLTAFTQYQLSLSGLNSGGEGPMVTCVHRTLDKGN